MVPVVLLALFLLFFPLSLYCPVFSSLFCTSPLFVLSCYTSSSFGPIFVIFFYFSFCTTGLLL